MSEVMSELRYYKGKHKVMVVTKSRGYWIVEAQESFEDNINGNIVSVKVGEKRIVAPNLLHKRIGYPIAPKEHAHELKMERKLKRRIEKGRKKVLNHE